ncbi:uncharacterized protein UHO2_06794 [Ustilago hordei]|uniref:uncharacterized protein n=1 Tax=Ustilago hordei TaxID=120017 RepID=UPI001A5C0C42|nr:uncharacterized protein UHO2_06794 [Ustilago hordei]SYW83580.1 uncharacterized protein UHO2_06794 [Ustilago hordei]
MIPNPFPRVLLISFFLATLSLAFNPGSKRGHLNRRGEEQSVTAPQPVRPSSSSPFIPSPPPSTDVSSRPDLSTGFRRSSSLPNNFSPLSSYKPALDTAEWSADLLSPNARDEQSLPADVPEAEIKETYPSDQNLAPISRQKVRWSNLKPSAITFSSRLAKVKSENGNPDSFFKNVPERWPTRLRTKLNWWTAMARPVGPNQQQMDQNPVAGRRNRLGDRVGSAWGRMKTASSNIGENVRGLFKGGNPSAAVSDARQEAGKGKNIALAAEPLPSGALDKYLTNPANSHIKEAISQLPQTTDAYQLVSYSDPTAPGGAQVYRFYNKPNHDVYRESVGYVPPILHDAKKAEAEIKETYPSDQNLAKKKVGFNLKNNMIGEPENAEKFSTPRSAFSSRLAKVKDSISSRFAPVQEKMRIHLADLKDHIAIAKNPRIVNYYTTGGKPAVHEFGETASDRTIPYQARDAAQTFGEARVFYDPKNYKNQVRVVYTGQSPGGGLAPPEMFGTSVVPENKALPWPKAWRPEGVRDTMSTFGVAHEGTFLYRVPERWPTRLRTKVNQLPTRVRTEVKQWPTRVRTEVKQWPTKVKQWPTKVRTEVNQWPTKVRTQVNQWPTKVRTEVNQWPTKVRTQVNQLSTRVRTEVNQWPTRVRTEVKQWPTKVRTEVNQWPTRLRTKANRLTAMVRPVGPNQQQIDQNPVAGRWNRLGNRVGSAWGKMQTASSNLGEKVRGLFKGGNPSAVVSGAREVARPIRR